MHEARELCSQYIRKEIKLHLLFIDDSSRRSKIWKTMNKINYPFKAYWVKLAVKWELKMICPIKYFFKNRLRQGDALACILLNIKIEIVVRRTKANTKHNFFSTENLLLAYADCICVIGKTDNEVKKVVPILEH